MAIGATPATAGDIRLYNGAALNWRNAANTGDIGWYVDSSDRISGQSGSLFPAGYNFTVDINSGLYIISNGWVGIGTTAPKTVLHVVGLPVYANNAAAVAGGLTVGAFYRTGGDPDPVCVVH